MVSFTSVLPEPIYKHRQPLVLFALALTARLAYITLILEHRLCIFPAVSSNIAAAREILSMLTFHSELTANAVNQLCSNGAIYLAYLTAVEAISGLIPSAASADSLCVQLAVCAAVIDAVTCVLIYYAGRLAFERRAAMIAAAIFAVYPTAVINTQHPYPEPIAYFLVSAWLCLLFRALLRHQKRRQPVWFFVGLGAGIIGLTKPLLLAMPLGVAAVGAGLIAWRRASRASMVEQSSIIAPEIAVMPQEGKGLKGIISERAEITISVGASDAVSADLTVETGTEPQQLTDDAVLTVVIAGPVSGSLAPTPDTGITISTGRAEAADTANGTTEKEPPAETDTVSERHSASSFAFRPRKSDAVKEEEQEEQKEQGEESIEEGKGEQEGEAGEEAKGQQEEKAREEGKDELPVAGAQELLAPVEPQKKASVAESSGKRRNQRTIALLITLGFLVLVVPWMVLLSVLTAQVQVSLERIPSLHLYFGNNIRENGWKYIEDEKTTVPATLLAAASEVGASFSEDPISFISMQLRKVPRLWAGVWNDFEYRWLFMEIDQQNLVQQLCLFWAVLGFVYAFTRAENWRLSRTFLCGLLLAAVVLFHFVYCAFDPVSRYNATAIPAIVLLAAYGLWESIRRGQTLWGFVRLSFFASVLFWFLQQHASFLSILASITPGVLILIIPWLDTGIWVWLWVLLARATLRMVADVIAAQSYVLARKILIAVFAIAILCNVSYCLGDPARKEWVVNLRGSGRQIRQDIYLPPMAGGESLTSVAFILVDMESSVLLPLTQAKLNGQPIAYRPIPWLQLTSGESETVKALALQSRAMERDLRSFRQWWAIPVPTAWLHFGGSNQIQLSVDNPQLYAISRVYGDYTMLQPGSNEGRMILPSLQHFSLSKGFFTFDHRDPRIYESTRILGKTSDAYLHDGINWTSDDLSDERGIQRGEYRIRLALPFEKTSSRTEVPSGLTMQSFFEPVNIIGSSSARSVSGADPASMNLTSSPLKIPIRPPSGSQYFFSCELGGYVGGAANIDVEFSGEEDDRTVKWRSIWQPYAIPTFPEWRAASFTGTVPDRIARLKNLRVNVTVRPFHPDKLQYGYSSTRSDWVAVRDAHFVVLPPFDLPPPLMREWHIY